MKLTLSLLLVLLLTTLVNAYGGDEDLSPNRST